MTELSIARRLAATERQAALDCSLLRSLREIDDGSWAAEVEALRRDCEAGSLKLLALQALEENTALLLCWRGRS